MHDLVDTHGSTESCRQMVLTNGLHKSRNCPCMLPFQRTRLGARRTPRSFSLQDINILPWNCVSRFAACPNETAFQIKAIFTINYNVNEHWGDWG